MEKLLSNINEQLAEKAFTRQSKIFDTENAANTIVQYKRERVRAHVSKYLSPGNHILELNCGTGEDAIWFAKQGMQVHATDISTGMLSILAEKIKSENLESHIGFEPRSFTSLGILSNKGPYDLIFSNFAGLNCTTELDLVLKSFNGLLKPNGIVTLVLLPPFCLWELMMVFKGKFRTATRRIFHRKGVNANVESVSFKCRYYSPSYVVKALKPYFKLLETEGLCTVVPPSYIENFAENYPRLFQFLKSKEERWKSKWPWKLIGDYYIITFGKK
jgi:ubiquinone/menaquinone biosynthesis C-methylase UbiE